MKTDRIRNWKTGVAVILAIFMMTTTALAFSPGGRKGQAFGRSGGHHSVLGIWQQSRAVKALGLTEDQVARLKEADFAAREKRIELSARMDRLRLELQRARATDPLDADAVRKAAKKVAAEMGAMFLHRTETYLTAADILTPEQLDKVKQFRGKRGHQGRRARGPEKGWQRQPGSAFNDRAPLPDDNNQQ
jgi:Spy/CpxP family protein refolding chaperone